MEHLLPNIMENGAFAPKYYGKGSICSKILWKMEHLLQNIMENGAFAPNEQMLLFP